MNKKIIFNIIGVIIILTILSIFIVPKVIDSFKEASEDGFVAQIQGIIRKINDDSIKNKSFTNATGKDAHNYKCNSSLDIKINHDDFMYSVIVDFNGNITNFNAKSDTYEYIYNGKGLLLEKVTKKDVINIVNKDSNLDMKLCK